MDERCILVKLGESKCLFLRSNLNLFKNASREKEVFSLWTWHKEILVEFLSNAKSIS